jgi:hypothetical protein
MINILIRFIIFFIAIFIISILEIVIDSSFFAIIFFMCIWLSIRSFEEIFWWICGIGIYFSVMHYDLFALYVLIIIATAFIFDYLKTQISRSRKNNLFFQYLLVLGTTTVISLPFELFYDHSLINVFFVIMKLTIATIVFFYPLYYIIERFERLVDLYSRGSDVKCHT